MRRDVARGARVHVVAPGAAEVLSAVEEHVVVDALLGELDGCAESGEAGSDDRDLYIMRCHGPYDKGVLTTSQ